MKDLAGPRRIDSSLFFPTTLCLLLLSALLLSCGQEGGNGLAPEAASGELVEIDDDIFINPETYQELARLASSEDGTGYPLEETEFDDFFERAQSWADDSAQGESVLVLGNENENRIKVSGFPTAGFRPRNFTDDQYANLAADFLLSHGLIEESPEDRIGQMSVHELAALDDENGPRKVEEIFVAATRFVRGERAFFSNAIVRLDPETGTVRGFNIKNWLPFDVRDLSRYRAKNLRTILVDLVQRLRRQHGKRAGNRVILESCTRGWGVSGEALVPALDCSGYLTPEPGAGQGVLPQGLFVNLPLVLEAVPGQPVEEEDTPQSGFPQLQVLSVASRDASDEMDRTANQFTDAWDFLYGTERSVHLDSSAGDGDLEDGAVLREYFARDPDSPEERSFQLDTFDVAFLESHGCADTSGREQSRCVALGADEQGNNAGVLFASGSREDRLAPLGDQQLEWAIFTASSFLTSYTADLPCSDCARGQDTRYHWEKEWGGVFRGLHGALGFSATASFGNGSGAELIRDFVRYLRFYPVRWAWYEAIWDNWSTGEKPCCASTCNTLCRRRCNYLEDPDGDKVHCCPTVSRSYWDDGEETWKEQQLGSGVLETVVRPGFAGAMTIPRNSNERIGAMQPDCREGPPLCGIRHSYMTGHQACEVWKDDAR